MDGAWMVRLVDLVAPRSPGDAAARSCVFLALINATDFAVKAALGQDWPALHVEVAITTLIALPFVLLIMLVLCHQRRLQMRLSVLATTDMLTGLPNRRDFMAQASTALGSGGGALLLMDADHFKRINDRWGHAAGDACLIAIAAHLRASVRPGDILGRLGGEEFAAFLPGASEIQVECLAERLCTPIPLPHEGAAGGAEVTLSIGAALGADSLDRLIAQADRLLYRAKAQGRARLCLGEDLGLAA